MAASWRYGSVSDAVDSICEGTAPWVGDISDAQFRELLDAYWVEQLAIAEGVDALEAHANGRGASPRVTTDDVDPNPTGRRVGADHEEDTDGP